MRQCKECLVYAVCTEACRSFNVHMIILGEKDGIPIYCPIFATESELIDFKIGKIRGNGKDIEFMPLPNKEYYRTHRGHNDFVERFETGMADRLKSTLGNKSLHVHIKPCQSNVMIIDEIGIEGIMQDVYRDEDSFDESIYMCAIRRHNFNNNRLRDQHINRITQMWAPTYAEAVEYERQETKKYSYPEIGLDQVTIVDIARVPVINNYKFLNSHNYEVISDRLKLTHGGKSLENSKP